jgi:hypothetical protein
MDTDRTHRSEAAAPAPPIVRVEVIRKGGALLAAETYGTSLGLSNGAYLGTLLAGGWSESEPLVMVVVVNLFAFALGTAMLWSRRDHRLELSALGINVVASAFRSRSLTWPEISELAEQRVFGNVGFAAMVRAHPSRNAYLLSSGVGPWRDPDYEAKAQRIRDYWTAYRWSSYPPPTERPPPPTAPS